MASVQKRGGKWRVRWRWPAGRDGAARSRSCPDAATARRVRAFVEREIAEGREPYPADDGRAHQATLGALVEAYLVDSARRVVESTQRARAYVLAGFLAWAGEDRPASDLTREMVGAYYDHLRSPRVIPSGRGKGGRGHAGQRTVQAGERYALQTIRHLEQVQAWGAGDARWPGLQPVRRLSLARPEVEMELRRPAPTWAQMDAAIAACTGRRAWYGRLLTAMRCTGWDKATALAADWSWLDLDAALCRIPTSANRKRRARLVPLAPVLAAELAGWGMREGPLVVRPCEPSQHTLRAIWQASGAPPDVWGGRPAHGMRHGVRSELVRARIPERAIDRLLGHVAGGSTGRSVYTDDASLMDEMREGVAAIPPIGRVVALGTPRTHRRTHEG